MMTPPTPETTTPTLGTALKNRKIQMILGLFAAAAAASTAALAVQAADAPVTSRAQVEQIVRSYLLEHPEILPEAMERLQAKRMSAVISDKRTDLETPYAGAWEGAAKGEAVLVEFFDYACGYCRASMPDIARLAGGDAKLKIVYRDLPILSDESRDAAKVSLLAAERGRYMAFHKAMFAAGRITRDTILAAAQSAGLDRKSAEDAMANSAYDAELEKNIRLAQAIGATGTPTFVVGDKVLSGAVGYDSLKEAVAAAHAKE